MPVKMNGRPGEEWTRKDHNDPPLFACPETVAIVGMGCRWPGGASDPSKLWQMLTEGRNGFSKFDQNRLNIDGFYHPDQQRPGSMSTNGGYFLQEDPREFDHAFFGITPTEVTTMDPAQRKLLEVTYEALESAGESWETVSGSNTGVFVGNFNVDHHFMQVRDSEYPLPYAATGGDASILSNRINYIFNLHGPSVSLNTACSSSMYALHIAVQALRNGDCDAAIVAGSNLVGGPDNQMLINKLGALSSTSTCHTFDAAADGYARAEGFGALYLKLTSKTLDKSDRIRAIIRGTAVNSNGRTGGISHPSPEGQEAVIRQAYVNAGGLDPNLTGYFECHGTGTKVGDPLEVSAIGRVFGESRRRNPLHIGSIKTNLGHSESASGMAGIMKVVLAIEHGIIPPTIGLTNPNPNIDFSGAGVHVVTQLTPWPQMPVRRASVNSFGYGGANAHCIIEEAASVLAGLMSANQNSHKSNPTSEVSSIDASPSLPPKESMSQRGGVENVNPEISNAHSILTKNGLSKTHIRPWVDDENVHASTKNINGCNRDNPENVVHSSLNGVSFRLEDVASRRKLLLFSGHNETSLNSNITAVEETLAKHKLVDVAHTLASRPSNFPHRAFLVAAEPTSTGSPGLHKMSTFGKTTSKKRDVVFVFTGQGAQWAGMGQDLYYGFQTFRRSIDQQDLVLARLSNGPSWSIRDILTDNEDAGRIHEPIFSQTLCTAVQIALVDLLRSWSVFPVACVGHSSGEIAAAYAAGYQTLAESIVTAYFRGRIAASNQRNGRMLAVGLGHEQVQQYIRNRQTQVKIAAVNSPKSVTLSGDAPQIEEVQQLLEKDGVFTRVLKTGGNAYHSHHMAVLGEAYEQLLYTSYREILDIKPHTPLVHTKARWVSSAIPENDMPQNLLGPSYWKRNLESPVLFSQAIEALATRVGDTPSILCEIGPHPALTGSIKQHQAEVGNQLGPCFPSLVRGKDGVESILTLCGHLFLWNAKADFVQANATEVLQSGIWQRVPGSIIHDMAPYRYSYGPINFYENRISREWRLRKHLRHDLLGARQPGCSRFQPSWRNKLRLKDVPWLQDHKLLPHPVFPGAGYIAMAVEAVRQKHAEEPDPPPIKGYTLRSVSIKSTMQVPDDEVGIETLLNMRGVDIKYVDDFCKWYEFSICSVNGEIWTEHCQGRIRVEIVRNDLNKTSLDHEAVGECVAAHKWYERFEQAGLCYSGCFRGLGDINVQNRGESVTAQVPLEREGKTEITDGSNYTLHPSTLDMLFQLAIISCHEGRPENLQSGYVPVEVANISIWRPDEINETTTLTAHGAATGSLQGLRGAHAAVQLLAPTGELLVDVKDLRCVTYDGSAASSQPESARSVRDPYFRMIWKPNIASLNKEKAKTMFPPTTDTLLIGSMYDKLDRLSCYTIVELLSDQRRPLPTPSSSHLQSFLAWLESMAKSAQEGTLKHGKAAVAATSSQRVNVIESLAAELDGVAEAQIILHTYRRMDEIFRGDVSGIEVAMEQDLLQQLYVSGLGTSCAYPQLLRLIDLVAHQNPMINVLEIGAGTGGATRPILDSLGGQSLFKRYGTYTFTDVTTSFLAAAEEKFADCHGVTYKRLNADQDPLTQGFVPEYDLIVASQVLHATKNLSQALQNCRKLLRPGGKLILLEMTRTILAAGLCLGTFPDYWNGTHDGRGDSPLISTKRWNELMIQSGFSGTDIILDDHEEPVNLSSIILTTAVGTGSPLRRPSEPHSTMYLIHGVSPSPLSNAIQRRLCDQNFHVIHVALSDVEDQVPHQSRMISLVEMDNHESVCKSSRGFGGVKSVLKRCSTLLWVAPADPMQGSNPESAIMIGLLRTVATETPQARFAHISLAEGNKDKLLDADVDLILETERQLCDQSLVADRDIEYIVKDGCQYISRLVPDKCMNRDYRLRHGLTKEFRQLEIGNQNALRLRFESPGLLSSMFFEQDPELQGALPEDWVEIETRAIGLNMKDVSVAMGKFDLNQLSTECAGVVTKVGSAVKNLEIGSRVYGLVPGNMGNYVRGRAGSLQKMAETDDFDEMASIPVAYCTAIYALNHLARLRKGESVLVHSAAGALGIATCRIARHLGADIYATVGSEEKIHFLMTEFGISRNRIFSSRSMSTFPQLMAATKGAGIDVVLCSAAGDQMQEMLHCLAPAGRFIEVGRTGVLKGEKLGLEAFKNNATFSSFDLGLLKLQMPELVDRLMQEVETMFRKDVIKSMTHLETFDISRLEQAMAKFSKGMHIGKVVVTLQDPSSTLKIRQQPAKMRFDPNATNLLVGCLGGIGKCISTWMVEQDARHLTFLSRSGGEGSETEKFVANLRQLGAAVDVVRCDVSNKGNLMDAIHQVTKHRSIRGVVHAAMVEGDASFGDVSFEHMQRVLSPKVHGTQNLHEATLNQPLEFFIMTSSISAVLGLATQACYAASNAFQDAFARHRMSLGLPAKSVALGMIDDVGFLRDKPDVRQALMRNSVYGTSKSEMLRWIEGAMTAPIGSSEDLDGDCLAQAHLLTGFEPGKLIELYESDQVPEFTWKNDPRFSSVFGYIKSQSHGKGKAPKSSTDPLLSKLKTARPEEVKGVVSDAIVERLSSLLLVSADHIDTSHAVSSYGVDSMIAAELRNWLVKSFQFEVSFLELLSPRMSVERLVEICVPD